MFAASEGSLNHLFAPPIRGQIEAQIEQLKQKLMRRILEDTTNTELVRELARAGNEAAALAWFTVCPMLVLPTLLEEKLARALEHWQKQEQLRQRQSSQEPNSSNSLDQRLDNKKASAPAQLSSTCL